MILHYKNPTDYLKRPITSKLSKVLRRKKKVKTLSKNNKDFLKSLGFKL